MAMSRTVKVSLILVAGVFTAFDLYMLYKDLTAPKVKKGSIRYMTKAETEAVNADLRARRAAREAAIV